VLADPIAFSTIIDLIVVHFGVATWTRSWGSRHAGSSSAPRWPTTSARASSPSARKGKLPHDTLEEEYALEYGTATLEIHRDAVRAGERVLVVDDVLATGGTAQAAAKLVERVGGKVCGIAT
jgi:adenine phosphoribosyltransferase